MADGEDDGTVTSEEDEPAPDAPTDVTETEKVSCCRCFLDLPRAFICKMQYTCRNRSLFVCFMECAYSGKQGRTKLILGNYKLIRAVPEK